ncbi:DUF1801 domain-containing protein [Herbiconiux sp. P15]|uniref:DUF1801 domain-containing protein n=1 Tax=Herbiconiux liukaitaii TaxID=3342799 RepID=UPI0035B794F1
MRENSTRSTDADVTGFLDAVAHPRRREEGHRLRELLTELTGHEARMWGPSIVGFGSSPYTNSAGTHDWFTVGFSPRKAALTLYGVHNDYGPPDPLLEQLGPHTTGKGCLYVKRLDAVDLDVLSAIVRAAYMRAADDTAGH